MERPFSLLTVGNIGETSGDQRGDAASNHAEKPQRKQSRVSSPRWPVERIVVGVVRLGLEDDRAIRRFLLDFFWERRMWRGMRSLVRDTHRERRMGCPSRGMSKAKGLVATLGEEQHRACVKRSAFVPIRILTHHGTAVDLPGTSIVCLSFRMPMDQVGFDRLSAPPASSSRIALLKKRLVHGRLGDGDCVVAIPRPKWPEPGREPNWVQLAAEMLGYARTFVQRCNGSTMIE